MQDFVDAYASDYEKAFYGIDFQDMAELISTEAANIYVSSHFPDKTQFVLDSLQDDFESYKEIDKPPRSRQRHGIVRRVVYDGV